MANSIGHKDSEGFRSENAVMSWSRNFLTGGGGRNKDKEKESGGGLLARQRKKSSRRDLQSMTYGSLFIFFLKPTASCPVFRPYFFLGGGGRGLWGGMRVVTDTICWYMLCIFCFRSNDIMSSGSPGGSVDRPSTVQSADMWSEVKPIRHVRSYTDFHNIQQPDRTVLCADNEHTEEHKVRPLYIYIFFSHFFRGAEEEKEYKAYRGKDAKRREKNTPDRGNYGSAEAERDRQTDG